MSAVVPRKDGLFARCWPVGFTWNGRAVRYLQGDPPKAQGNRCSHRRCRLCSRGLTSVQYHTRRHHQPAQIGNRRFHVKPSDFLVHEAGPSTTHRNLAPLARRWQLDPEELIRGRPSLGLLPRSFALNRAARPSERIQAVPGLAPNSVTQALVRSSFT